MMGTSLPPPSRVLSCQFSFAATVEAMDAVRDQVMRFVAEYCPSREIELDIVLAFQEALANAVIHGCRSAPSKTIDCRVEVDALGISIVVRDPGPGFSVESAVPISHPAQNLSDHGRGISIMRSLMDQVTYSEGGSEVRITKLLRHDAPSQA